MTDEAQPQTPEEELAVIVEDAMQYKGVSVSLPEPVVRYIEQLHVERSQLFVQIDALNAKLVAGLPPAPPIPPDAADHWTPVEVVEPEDAPAGPFAIPNRGGRDGD